MRSSVILWRALVAIVAGLLSALLSLLRIVIGEPKP